MDSVNHIIKKISMSRRFKIKFKHYAFQTIMVGMGIGTAGVIIFALVTIVNEMLLWEILV